MQRLVIKEMLIAQQIAQKFAIAIHVKHVRQTPPLENKTLRVRV